MEESTRTLAVTKQIWKTIKLFFATLLKRGIASSNLNLHHLLERGTHLASGALESLLLTLHSARKHHHHHHHIGYSSSFSRKSFQNDAVACAFASQKEYEFSCGNSPAPNSHSFFFFNAPKRGGGGAGKIDHRRFKYQETDAAALAAAVQRVFDMLNAEAAASAPPSPAIGLPGFGNSPMVAVRQLRVTDSPFPLSESCEEEVAKVNRAAEEFIRNFYGDLKKQRAVVGVGNESPFY